MPSLPTLDSLCNGIRAGHRGTLARGITLVESSRASHRDLAQSLLQSLLPDTGGAIRLGISGVPGVGKSTFIEALGMHLIGERHRVAVLAIDPSSRRTGGSILGDKTRMAQLGLRDEAFIRPSPTGGHLGGVNRVTRESVLLCEAAGYDVVIVETVGVGQSETAVADMVDCFLMLMLPGAGDELQGIKKGVLEIADLIAVNKADGEALRDAQQARAAYQRALSILQPSGQWKPRALLLSALSGHGLVELWDAVLEHRRQLQASGELDERREAQQIHWLWASVEQALLSGLRTGENMRLVTRQVEQAVSRKEITVPQGVAQLMAAWREHTADPSPEHSPAPGR